MNPQRETVARTQVVVRELPIRRVLTGLTRLFADLSERYLPDPFVLVILLTVLTLILGVLVGHKTPVQMTAYWSDALWNFLAFSMQMALVVVTGYTFAASPPVTRLLTWVAMRFHGPRGAIVCTTLVGALGGYINWGFGLIIGTLMARQFAKTVRGIHYPLLIFSAYTGWILYGLGLSATIPITLATPGNPFQSSLGGLVPLSYTVFLPPVVMDAVILAVTLPILNVLVHPKPADVLSAEPTLVNPQGHEPEVSSMPAERLEHSRFLNLVLVAMGAMYLVRHFALGGSLDINTLNALFLCLGLLMHGTPARYVAALSEGIRGIAGIVLQYPLYAGIMGMMKGAGLDEAISTWLGSVSSAHTLPFWGFITSLLINFFAPSSGGHWAIQGPFMIEAAKHLGADLGKTAMAVQMGCSWQDILQPFWLIPVLALARLHVRQVMGYAVLPFLWIGLVYGVTILVW